MRNLNALCTVAAVIALAGCEASAAPADAPNPTADPPGTASPPTAILAAEGPNQQAAEEATVIRVIDGDTIEAEIDGTG